MACPSQPTENNTENTLPPCEALLQAARQDLKQVYAPYFKREAVNAESFQQETCQDLNGDGREELIVRGSGPWFGKYSHFSVYTAQEEEGAPLKARRLYQTPYLGRGDTLSIKDSAQDGWRNLKLTWTEYPLELPEASPPSATPMPSGLDNIVSGQTESAQSGESPSTEASPESSASIVASGFPDPEILRDSIPDDMRDEIDLNVEAQAPEADRLNIPGAAPSRTPHPDIVSSLPKGKTREETLSWGGERYSSSQHNSLVIGDRGEQSETGRSLEAAGEGKMVPYRGLYLKSGKKIELGAPVEAVEAAYGKAEKSFQLGDDLKADLYPGFLTLSENGRVQMISVGGELKEIRLEAFEHPYTQVELISGHSFGDHLSSLGEKFETVNTEAIGLRHPQMLEMIAEGLASQALGTHVFMERGVAVAAIPQEGGVVVPDSIPKEVKASVLANAPTSENLPQDDVLEQSPSELQIFRILLMSKAWIQRIYSDRPLPQTSPKASANSQASSPSDSDLNAAGDLRYVSEDGVRLRRQPSTNAPIIVLSSRNMPLKKTATAQRKEDSYTWQEVELPWGGTAWIATSFLKTGPLPEISKHSTQRIEPNDAESKVNIRAYPTTQAEVVSSVSSAQVKAYPRFVRNDNYVWQCVEIQVNGQTKTGWVVKDFVR